MFDLDFYASISGFVKYMHYLMHKTLPNAEGHSQVSILKFFNNMVCSISILIDIQVTNIFVMKDEDHHISHMDYYFNYYMKVYYKYFNLNYPSSSNK